MSGEAPLFQTAASSNVLVVVGQIHLHRDAHHNPDNDGGDNHDPDNNDDEDTVGDAVEVEIATLMKRY